MKKLGGWAIETRSDKKRKATGRCTPAASMGLHDLPPFPIPVDKFIEEVESDDASTAAQCCAAFATLATKVPVPRDFRGACRSVMELVERTGNGFGRATKESASAAMAALLACVPGADKHMVQRGVVGKLVAIAVADEEDGEGDETPAAADGTSGTTRRGGVNGMGSLTLNALECIRILAASEHGVSELMKNDEAMDFATRRCDSGDARIAECACDVLCALASHGVAHRTRVKDVGGVGALARALARHGGADEEVALRALLGLAMTCAQDADAQAELVRVDGAVPALLAAQRSGRDAACGISKDLWGSIGKNQTLKKAAMEALRADVERARLVESA